MTFQQSADWLRGKIEQLGDIEEPGVLACGGLVPFPTTKGLTMFHWKDGLYFGRMPDGSVRVIQQPNQGSHQDFPRIDAPVEGALLDVTIPAAEWASITSSVSATSETSESYQAALALHG